MYSTIWDGLWKYESMHVHAWDTLHLMPTPVKAYYSDCIRVYLCVWSVSRGPGMHWILLKCWELQIWGLECMHIKNYTWFTPWASAVLSTFFLAPTCKFHVLTSILHVSTMKAWKYGAFTYDEKSCLWAFLLCPHSQMVPFSSNVITWHEHLRVFCSRLMHGGIWTLSPMIACKEWQDEQEGSNYTEKMGDDGT